MKLNIGFGNSHDRKYGGHDLSVLGSSYCTALLLTSCCSWLSVTLAWWKKLCLHKASASFQKGPSCKANGRRMGGGVTVKPTVIDVTGNKMQTGPYRRSARPTTSADSRT